jgi:activating signal cointegrator complex subunit 3
VRATSDRWLGSETTTAISFQHLILPERHPPHTDLLDLQPLPITALQEPSFQALYKFTHFNPVQTQIFHTLYHTDKNVLLGAPTGSGKTIAAELAIFRVFRETPKAKVVYIAPMKALVRERVADWKKRLEGQLGKSVVELTGDVTPDARAIARSSVIVTTPEKWDGVSRSWQNRNFVQDVALIVIDEIHLLGQDRGPVLEVIVSRTNFISSHTGRRLRVVGLSTALANAKDLADWLGIGQMGLFNFRPSVRPVPLECHISGYAGKHYCPRMDSMNKPTFQGIKQHSPTKPSLVFVSSRRQTRATALALMAFLTAEDNHKPWLHMEDAEMERVLTTVKDQNLKLTLAFGIGIHHAGLVERDRRTVEELYVNMKIQVLVATSTLAWGVNFPTHLVVVKGTEFFDGKLKR